MSKRRGLSLEEKRTRMMALFFERKDVFQLKELEKLGHKEKGINSMVVKDIVHSLIDDGLVDTDRVGISNYFWSFPSKAVNKRMQRLEDLEKQLSDLETKRSVLTDKIAEAQVGREESDERTQLLKQLEAGKEEKKQLAAELESHRTCDPERIKELRGETAVAKEAANRWTDNVFGVKTWCNKRFGMEEKAINKQFDIPEDLDYV
ncbi:meiotic nuclear division protein 1 homolog [Halichondria panicea]|uniref:meiotic nuclear division protein 1 homolog n=1 Tax=Halichondria panicea TaxID=6063 RepID=UPI00312B3E5A